MKADPLQVVTKWRAWFAGWQLGSRPKGEPECDAVRDHRELTILMRVELNALAKLMIDKKVFTEQEWSNQLDEEATHYDLVLSERFPGVYATGDGLTYTREAAVTMQRMNFKP